MSENRVKVVKIGGFMAKGGKTERLVVVVIP